ncbi:MAG: anaerobic glycerol-3-phosphate dehydrogenase subunit A [Candidatus Lokiarchaeota archaeon]|nr:anaerobic glycerol-3-phosphate dehydrogenase subunit A [Candidatus Lokiarchaeota archaeon]MBD3337857.1 anaerobic glycerol-3-phosphate dehydrogenase subunit A [Candidatus Lokiarchaeota archaeon]
MTKFEFDCIIIGGGATGAGIARDLSLRGLKICLVEKNDLSEGTTGRCHAMLHSGGRYVYRDGIAATECAEESQILLKIAPHITELCGGYFIAIDDEDVKYGETFRESCRKSGVWCEEISPQAFLKNEPNCNKNVKRIFKVNDGYIDPFLLTIYNAYDAHLHGAEIRTYTKATDLILENEQIVGIKCQDKLDNSKYEIYGKITINATGPWAAYLEKDLDLKQNLEIAPTMGTLIVIKDRIVSSLINRLREPGDGDIIVPSHQSVILGTTSKLVNLKELDNLLPDREEIEYLLDLGEYLIPTIRTHQIVRFYSGARPLLASGGPLRETSRKFDIIDYKDDGYEGFITIFGGKLTTYRLMAEKTSDLICEKLGYDIECQTARKPLPGGEKKITQKIFEKKLSVDEKTAFDMQYKWGTFYTDILNLCDTCMDSYSSINKPRTICECENVTEPELAWTYKNLMVKVMDDYRRRTRQGMGPCQGQFCYYKLANLEAMWTDKTHIQIMKELKVALHKRWKIEASADEYQKRQIKLAKYVYLLGGNLK